MLQATPSREGATAPPPMGSPATKPRYPSNSQQPSQTEILGDFTAKLTNEERTLSPRASSPHSAYSDLFLSPRGSLSLEPPPAYHSSTNLLVDARWNAEHLAHRDNVLSPLSVADIFKTDLKFPLATYPTPAQGNITGSDKAVYKEPTFPTFSTPYTTPLFSADMSPRKTTTTTTSTTALFTPSPFPFLSSSFSPPVRQESNTDLNTLEGLISPRSSTSLWGLSDKWCQSDVEKVSHVRILIYIDYTKYTIHQKYITSICFMCSLMSTPYKHR